MLGVFNRQCRRVNGRARECCDEKNGWCRAVTHMTLNPELNGQVVLVFVAVCLWLVYNRILLPLADRFEQVGLHSPGSDPFSHPVSHPVQSRSMLRLSCLENNNRHAACCRPCSQVGVIAAAVPHHPAIQLTSSVSNRAHQTQLRVNCRLAPRQTLGCAGLFT
jgi:hypothetical protein